MDEKMIQAKYKGASVYQSKPLIEACKKFDINEGRLFYLGLLELRPQLAYGKGQEKFDEVIIPTADVIKLFGGNPGYYNKLKAVAKRLIDHSITVRDDDNSEEFKYISIFDMLHFDKKLGGLHIKFNDTMRPYILELADKPYTKIAVKTIFALNSHYAIRLMELMLEYQNISEFKRTRKIKRRIMIKDLRFYCGIDDSKYNTTTNFTQNVVVRPCEEINNSTPYQITYEYIKKGRMIVGYDFVLKVPETSDNVETIEQLVESNTKAKIQKAVNSINSVNVDENIYKTLIMCGVGKIVARRLISQYDEERIRNNIKYVQERKNIKNVGAYLRSAIENDYYSIKGISSKTSTADNEDILKKLKKLGLGPIASNLLISSVKEDKTFGMTERGFCDDIGISPDDLYYAIKFNDFSSIMFEKPAKHEKDEDVYDYIEEDIKAPQKASEDEKQDMQEIFISTLLSGDKVDMNFVKKAASLGINLADLASTLGMTIKECVKIK